MPSLTITRSSADNSILYQSNLNDAYTSIETFLNTTKLDSSNIQSGGIASTNLASNSVTSAAIATGAVGTASIATNAITLATLATEVSKCLVPTGSVLAWHGTVAPSGFLICDGSAVSRTTYSALYAIMGNSCGSGDGTTTFNIPDHRGRFLRGVDGGSGNDPDAGSRSAMNTGGNSTGVGSVQSDQFASHFHNETYGQVASGAVAGVAAANNTTAASAWNNTGSTGGNETRPKNSAVYWIIKT